MRIDPIINEEVITALESIQSEVSTVVATEMNISVSGIVELLKKIFSHIADILSEFVYRVLGWEKSSIQRLSAFDRQYSKLVSYSEKLKKKVTDINRPLGVYLGKVETHGAILANNTNDFLVGRVGVDISTIDYIRPNGIHFIDSNNRLNKNDVYDLMAVFKKDSINLLSAVESIMSAVKTEVKDVESNIERISSIVKRNGSSREIISLLSSDTNSLDIFNDVLEKINPELRTLTLNLMQKPLIEEPIEFIPSTREVVVAYPSSINVSFNEEVTQSLEPVVTVDLEFMKSLLDDYSEVLKIKLKGRDLKLIEKAIKILSKRVLSLTNRLYDPLDKEDSNYEENVRASTFVLNKLILRLSSMNNILVKLYETAIISTNLNGKIVKDLLASHGDFLEKADNIVSNDRPLFNYSTRSEESVISGYLLSAEESIKDVVLTNVDDVANESILAIIALGLVSIIVYVVKAFWKFFNRYINFVAKMLWSSESNFRRRVSGAWKQGEEKLMTGVKYAILKNEKHRHLLEDISVSIAYRNNTLPSNPAMAVEDLNHYATSENENIITLLRSGLSYLEGTTKTLSVLNVFNTRVESLISILTNDPTTDINDTAELKYLTGFLNSMESLQIVDDNPNAGFLRVHSEYKMLDFGVPQLPSLNDMLIPVLKTEGLIFEYSQQVKTVRITPDVWLEMELFSSSALKGYNKRIGNLSDDVAAKIKRTTKDFKHTEKTIKTLQKSLQKNVKISGANEIGFLYNKLTSSLTETFRSYDKAARLCLDEAAYRVEIGQKVDDKLMGAYRTSIIVVNRETILEKDD